MPSVATSRRSFIARIRSLLRPQRPGMSDAEVAHRLRPHGQTLDIDEPPGPEPFSPEWVAALPPEGQEAYREWRPARDDIDTVPELEPDDFADMLDEIRDQGREGK